MLSPARSEYFAQGDCKECEACIAEVAASQRAEYCTRLVSRAIDLSLDKREREQEMVSALFVQLSRAGARCRQPRPVARCLNSRVHCPQGLSLGSCWRPASLRWPNLSRTSSPTSRRRRKFSTGLQKTCRVSIPKRIPCEPSRCPQDAGPRYRRRPAGRRSRECAKACARSAHARGSCAARAAGRAGAAAQRRHERGRLHACLR